MKTSISLDDQTLKIIDDYRRIQPKIPTLSEAIRQLVENTKVKEEDTELPKEANKLENITLHIRDPSPDRGGEAHLNLPYAKMKDLGLKDEERINLWILPKT